MAISSASFSFQTSIVPKPPAHKFKVALDPPDPLPNPPPRPSKLAKSLKASTLRATNPRKVAINKTKKMISLNLAFGFILSPVFSFACENGAVSCE